GYPRRPFLNRSPWFSSGALNLESGRGGSALRLKVRPSLHGGEPRGSLFSRRFHFVNPVAANPDLLVVLLDRLAVRGVEDTIEFVVGLAVQDVVVGHTKLVCGRLLRLPQLLRGERMHRVLVDELRHRPDIAG